MTDQSIARRFARETEQHEMTVLHDDGLYRHLSFRRCYWRPPLARKQRSSLYWFDLITVPGALIFQGDGDSFVFRRIEDMFEFFRSPVGRINPGYWAEKLTSGRGQVMKYDQEILEARVKEEFVEAVRARKAPAGLGKAIREEILNSDEIRWEEGAHRVLAEFSFYKNDADRHARTEFVNGELVYTPAKEPDFQFYDTWEWNLQDYEWWFLWACHAIVWGIAYYDTGRRPEVPVPASAQDSTAPTRSRQNMPKRRSIVTVHLPELAGGA